MWKGRPFHSGSSGLLLLKFWWQYNVLSLAYPEPCLCLMQHYSELPDIKRVIVNTHAIEPQVLIAIAHMTHSIIKLFDILISYHIWCISGFSWVFWYPFSRMGTRVYERSFTCQSQGKSSNNCSGIISGQCCRKTSVLFFCLSSIIHFSEYLTSTWFADC